MGMLHNISETLRGAEEAISAIYKAFGSPGDYGYETKEGKALFALYRFQASVLSSALQEASAPAARVPKGDTEILKEAWSALNFILAFYEPGQRYLDTNAWKQAEASARIVHKKLRDVIDAPQWEA